MNLYRQSEFFYVTEFHYLQCSKLPAPVNVERTSLNDRNWRFIARSVSPPPPPPKFTDIYKTIKHTQLLFYYYYSSSSSPVPPHIFGPDKTLPLSSPSHHVGGGKGPASPPIGGAYVRFLRSLGIIIFQWRGHC